VIPHGDDDTADDGTSQYFVEDPTVASDPVTIDVSLPDTAFTLRTDRGVFARGQLDAGTSLGLRYWQLQRTVVMPQALVAVIPAFVNNLLSTFMDTSLVTVVSMYDLTGSLRLALGDPRWRDFFIEGYLFIASIYFLASFAMSRYSQWLERRLKIDFAR